MKRPLILSVIRYYQNNGVAFECISCYCDLTIFLAPLWQNVQDVYWGCCCLTNSVAEGINPDSFLDFFLFPRLVFFNLRNASCIILRTSCQKNKIPVEFIISSDFFQSYFILHRIWLTQENSAFIKAKTLWKTSSTFLKILIDVKTFFFKHLWLSENISTLILLLNVKK